MQEELLANEILKPKKLIQISISKFIIRCSILSLIITVFVFLLIFFVNYNQESIDEDSLQSGYRIYNLKGDIVNTWISWKIPEGTLFHIHLSESPYTTEERIDAILQVMMSDELISISNKELHKAPVGDVDYYLGWNGALNSIDAATKFPIPKEIHAHINDKRDGNVTINLKKEPHPEGYAGFTKSIADETNNQILKSEITIYDIENLSIPNLKTILRHELGHAFGLAHSTDPDDLMHPIILTGYPFISPCVISSITELYDGSQKTEVVCET